MSFAHIIFENPVIPPNTGNAIRLSAATGAHLHLVEPLGFNFDDKNLKRAGLDYHDLATVTIHPNLDTCFEALPDARIFAFSSHAKSFHTDVSYEFGDALLFGTEPSGLTEYALNHPRVTQTLRIPMLEGRRSLNLANAASIGIYEAWRQLNYPAGI
ncbi:MAG: tRNA (cytidine(34)-2'-O)-methyltransferase [Corynebacterium sp.]|nr:tRNA (cytidine(34)-2'-O)-methyltransferase [Corynebacterium sp.]